MVKNIIKDPALTIPYTSYKLPAAIHSKGQATQIQLPVSQSISPQVWRSYRVMLTSDQVITFKFDQPRRELAYKQKIYVYQGKSLVYKTSKFNDTIYLNPKVKYTISVRYFNNSNQFIPEQPNTLPNMKFGSFSNKKYNIDFQSIGVSTYRQSLFS